MEVRVRNTIQHVGMLGVCALPPDFTVSETARMMAMQRASAAAVIEDTARGSRVLGMFTERDVVVRIVCGGLDGERTQLREVMTRDPVTVRGTCKPLEALELMHKRRFRHLPIVTEDGCLVGMLDVLKLVQHLVSADEHTQKQGSGGDAAGSGGLLSRLGRFFRGTTADEVQVRVAERIDCIDASDEEAVCQARPQDSVRAVADIMAVHRASAVLVVQEGQLVGILTERDIVTRVVAKALDPHATPVSAVMTASPRCLPADASPLEAMRVMVRCGFRHIPVQFSHGEWGLLDMLQLAYGALERAPKVRTSVSEREGELVTRC